MEHPFDVKVRWQENGCQQSAQWRTASRPRPACHALVVGDGLRADRARRLAEAGTALLWRGDYRNARDLLDALRRRLDRRPAPTGHDPGDTFRRHRQRRAHQARVLGMLLVELGPDLAVDLPHAPDVRLACEQTFGPPPPGRCVISLTELLGAIGAYEWRRRGVEVPALGAKIHSHYGVFPPTRHEYVDLVAKAPWPDPGTVFDIGTGTGVLAALLARRGARRVVATDIEPRAVACALDNIDRLGLTDRVEVVRADLFPAGRADLIVCNPPWLPATPSSSLDSAVYDRRGRMLTSFVRGLPRHLTDVGEAWLLLSDLAELLGLRTRADLTDMITRAGLVVRGRLDIQAHHRTRLERDPLAPFRAAETTSLWRLGQLDDPTLIVP